MAGAAGIVLFVVGAATAPADGPPAGTATAATTVTATATTSAGATTTTATTTAPATTTASAPTTTAPATTTAPVTTTAPARKPSTNAPPVRLGAVAGVRQRSLVVGCPVAAVVLLLPHRSPLVLGAYADSSARQVAIARLVYRAGGGIVTSSATTLRERVCTPQGPTAALATVSSVSLFGGAVTASHVTLTRRSLIAATVTRLAVGGVPVSPRTRARIAVAGIGYLTVGSDVRDPVSRDVVATSALALHLRSARAGLPPGTVVLVAAIGLPVVPEPVRPRSSKPAHATIRRRARSRQHAAAPGAPLTVTPPLALRHYDFPVAGASEYIDTYGAFRSDVPGNWHHGDDIFAPLGTPVVAVAGGTINRVGWEKLGGWRLWVRDDAGDEFYYAHLSGYVPTDLRSNRVRAGEVIGFVGNTGDAFTTAPHLHFEVHPRRLLHLGYNGAVDPTTYLDHWTHLTDVAVPRPVDPPLPTQPQLRSEARYVFRELLAARHLVSHGPTTTSRPHVSVPAEANGVAPTPAQIERESAPSPVATVHESTFSVTTGVLIAALVGALCAGAGGAAAVWRRRRNDQVV
jgi:murein DD-endopeptidase MepM/ murein hydrolase activator NlpD